MKISFALPSKQLNQILSSYYSKLQFLYLIFFENKRKGKIKGMNVEILSAAVLYPKAVDRIQLGGLTFLYYIFSLHFLSPERVLCSLLCYCSFVLFIFYSFLLPFIFLVSLGFYRWISVKLSALLQIIVLVWLCVSS